MTVAAQETLQRSAFLRIAGIAVALGAILTGFGPDFSTVAAMVLAIVLFLCAERFEHGTPPEALAGHPTLAGEAPRWPLAARATLAMAIALCLGSAAAVAAAANHSAQHIPWAAGVGLFGLTAALLTSPPAMRWRRADFAAVGALLVVCAFTFGWQVEAIPPEVHGDEAEVGLDALRLLHEPGRGLFTSGWFGLPILHAGTAALGMLAFGTDLFGLRMGSAVLATASVLLLFSIVRRLAGTPVALTAAMVLATQRYFIHLGRTGFHYIDTPFLSLLALWLMIRLWQDRRSSSAIWCGVLLGLAMHTYFATRITPLLLVLTTIFVAVRAPRGERWHHLRELILVGVVALAVAAPLGVHFAGHLDEFFGRVQETSILNAEAREHLARSYGTDSLIDLFALQVRLVLAMFHFVGDTSVQYGYGAPLLDIVSGVLLLAGVGTLLARPARLLTAIALLWTLLPMIVGGALTIDTPFFPRLSGIVPFVAVIVGVGTVRIAESIAAVFAAPARRSATALLLAIAMLVAVTALNATSYFRQYAVHHLHSPLRAIGDWVREGGRGVKTYLLDDRHRVSLYHGTVSFLGGPVAREDVRDLDGFFANPMIDARRSRFIVLEGNDDLIARLQDKFGPLEIEPHRNRRGDVIFYGASSPAATPGGSDPRTSLRTAERAGPWIALMVILATMAGTAAIRQRRRRPANDAACARAAPIPPAVAPPPPPESARGMPPVPLLVAAMVVVLAVAGWLRMTQLEQIPAGFYCDEAGNLYNAASILRTGRDETGTLLPLYVWSFDTSYKNPVFIYASMLPVALFGPTPFAARATAAAFGIAAVLAVFLFGRAIHGPVVGVLAALFLAVVPWHLHFSRIAFELIAFPTLFLIGAIGLVRFLDGHRSLPWAAAFLAASLYTYVPAKMFVPAFLGAFALLFRRELWQRRRQTIAALTILLAVSVPVIVFDIANQERSTQYARDMTFLTGDLNIADMARQFAANYAHFFSPNFLFADGDPVTRHSVRQHGELYPLLAPLLLLGLVAIGHEGSRRRGLVLVWLALYPIAGSLIRREIPSASRGIIGVPAFCLLAAIGAEWVWRHSALGAGAKLRAGVIRGVLVAALAIILAAQTARYWRIYEQDYPLYSAKHFTGFQFGHQQVVDYFLEHYDEYDRLILTTNLSNQPEIFLRLFAGLHYPPTDGVPTFERPPKMDRGTPHELHLYEPGARTLFAVVPRDLIFLADYEVRETIRAPDGSVAFLIVEVHEAKDFAHVWMIVGPYPVAETPPLPEFAPERPPTEGPGGRPWRRYQLRRAPILVDTLFDGEIDNACAWAVNFVHSESQQTAHVYAGFDDMGEVWVNGEQVPLIEHDNPFNTWEDTESGTVELREGRNQIAVLTCDISGGWIFYFRLAGADGKRVPGIEWEYVFEEGL